MSSWTQDAHIHIPTASSREVRIQSSLVHTNHSIDLMNDLVQLCRVYLRKQPENIFKETSKRTFPSVFEGPRLPLLGWKERFTF